MKKDSLKLIGIVLLIGAALLLMYDGRMEEVCKKTKCVEIG